MSMSKSSISRREALRSVLGSGITLTLGSRLLFAEEGGFAWTQEGELLSKPIPSSGERIPLVGVGTARRYDVAASKEELAPLREVLSNLPKLGGKLVDTAPSYGRAEDVLGDLITELKIRDRIFLATKVGAGSKGREAGIKEIEASKKRLKTNRFDLLQVHNLNGVKDMLPVLRDMKQAGDIRYYGVTTTFKKQYPELEELMKKEPMDFLQIDYAIDNRDVEKTILPLAQEKGIAVLTALPFGRGRVFQAFKDKPIPGWAAELGIKSWPQFALKYIISHPAVVSAIPGTATMAYLKDNLGAARGKLPDQATRRKMAALFDAA